MASRMGEIDLSELGREIGEKVEKFVNSKEIKDLQENIKKTVETTISEVSRSAREGAEYINKNAQERREATQKEFRKSPYHEKYEKYMHADRQTGKPDIAYTRPVKSVQSRPLPIIKSPPGRVSGVLMTVFGSIGAAFGWLITLAGYTLSYFTGRYMGTVFWAILAGIGTVTAIVGGFLRRRAKRFKIYTGTMKTKDFHAIKDLANAVGKSNKFVLRDIKKMIRQGWFKEGHLDQQETCFMLTDESYKMYQEAQKELENRKLEEERLAREKELLEQDPVRKQLVVAVEEGREYIRRIREINDEIPGEEISQKLYRLEEVCTRIFEHVKDNPEKLADIRKFMSYYLPTTLKLVESYHEFSSQPVQGENITSSRKEIEEMLDNINGAFEKMFDKLFEDDAMDVSTDISVLSTLLAQEGLLEDEFKTKMGGTGEKQ